jgi:hypothetical protein
MREQVSLSLNLSFRSGHTVPEGAVESLYYCRMAMDREHARDVIIATLKLAKERVTGDLDQKEIRRERLADLIVRMDLEDDTPTAQDLAEMLGDPDDGEPELRRAMAAWSQEDVPSSL